MALQTIVLTLKESFYSILFRSFFKILELLTFLVSMREGENKEKAHEIENIFVVLCWLDGARGQYKSLAPVILEAQV